MSTPLFRRLLLALILLTGQTSGLLCELAHARDALGDASGVLERAGVALDQTSGVPVAAHEHSGTPELAQLHCHRCLLLAASVMPSNGMHVVPVAASGSASLIEGATTAPRELARHHRLARGPPDVS